MKPTDNSMDVSLQINLSGGDIAYAERTVPALVSAHRAHVREVFLVVDCVRPQRTQMIDPDRRFPKGVFDERVASIRRIARGFVDSCLVDRAVYVEEGSPKNAALVKKYAGWPIRETHDCYGCGLLSYLYAFNECRTPYLLHYDADMLLYQAPGYDWSRDARAQLMADSRGISATPRVSPPFAEALQRQDAPSLQATHPELRPVGQVWHIPWFSARCFLIDLDRLRRWLPLLSVRLPRYFVEVCVRKMLARGYPPPTEVLIHRRAQHHGAYRLDLVSPDAFVVHPNDKSQRFLELLPAIQAAVQRGHVPVDQAGWENLRLDEWEKVAAHG